MKTGKVIALIVLIVGLGFGGVYLAIQAKLGPVRETAETFRSAVAAGDLDASYATFSADLRDELGPGDLHAILESLGMWGRSGSFDFTTATRDGSLAELTGVWTRDDGAVVPVRLVLKREDGAWRIMGFHLGGSEA